MSYTTFEYANLEVSPAEAAPGGKIIVSAEITNTGNVSGEEVVQLYVADLVASRVRPVKELGGFCKIALKPGESRKVTFELEISNLGFYDEKMRYVVEAGNFKVWDGPNSKDGLEGEFKVL